MISLRKKMFVESLPSLLFFIILLTLCRDLNFSKMWAFGDLIAFPTDVSITQSQTFYVWRAEGLGSRSFPPINYYLVMFLSSIIMGSLIAQKIIFLFTLATSFLTFYFLLREMNMNLISSATGALVYSINPITVSEFIGGSMTLAVYSTFPLIFFYILKIITDQKFKLKDAVALGLLSFLIFNPHAAFWYILVVAPSLLLIILHSKESLKKMARLAIPLIIVVLILLPTIIGYATFFSETTSKGVTSSFIAEYCYKDSTFYNIVRLAGNTGSAQAKEFLNYNTLNSYSILGYTLPIIAFFPFLTKTQYTNKRQKILAMSAAFSFLVSSGLILTIKTLPFTVDVISILTSLRNPSKLMYPLSFSLAFLFALGTERLIINSSKKKVKCIFTSFILVTIILLYNFPALDGTLGLSKARGENYYIEDKYYTLPEILKKIDDTHNYRFLILPWEYPLLLKVRSQIPDYFGTPAGAGLTQDIEWQKNFFEIAVTSNSRDRSYITGLFGVKYVIIDKTYRSPYEGQTWYEGLRNKRSYTIYKNENAYWVAGECEYFLQIFNSDSNFKLVYENPDFAIFKNNKVIPKVYARSNNLNLTVDYTSLSENLLKNPSFENGTQDWQIWPSNLVNITYDQQGNKIMTLYGQEKWFTVCYQEVSVKENVIYNLKFSVKGFNITDMHAKVLWYNISEKTTEENYFSDNYIKLNQLDLKDGEWYDIDEKILVPKGALKARIYFLASRLNDFTNTEMYIDNVSFREVGLILKNIAEIIYSIRDINYTRINPTKYTVSVNAPEPFILSFSETYDNFWVCYVNGEKINSFPLYGAINGFYINQTGLLEITIEYEPQKWFYIGCAISLTTLLACTTYLTYSYTKSKQILKKLKYLLSPK